MKHNWKYKILGAEFRIVRLQDGGPHDTTALDTPERIVNYIRPLLETSVMYRPDVENFGVIFLTARFGAIGWQVISTGTLDSLHTHPREVFKPAIVMNSGSIVIFHNHPSGNPSPSEPDIKITRKLIRAGELLKIPIMDHIVLGRVSEQNASGFCSLRALGYFFTN